MTLAATTVVLVVGGVAAAGAAGLLPESDTAAGTSAGSAPDPTGSPAPEDGETTPEESDSPTPPVRKVGRVIDGLEVTKIPSLPELVARMQQQGMELTDPNTSSEFSFGVASFNILGASHKRPGYKSGVSRMGPAMSLLRGKGVSVAGIQEFQVPQIGAFHSIFGGSWGIYPGTSLGKGVETHNSIIWDEGVWELVDARTSRVPYFGGNQVPMPHVQLRHRSSGQLVWFGNYHNPADARGPAQHWRSQALAREAALARDLTADGTPMIITGDMNDRADYACPFTRLSGMHSADGAYTEGGNCHVPQRMNVDWIMGSSDIAFSGFDADFSSKDRKISDHPLITATGSIETELDTSDCVKRLSTEGTRLFCPTG